MIREFYFYKYNKFYNIHLKRLFFTNKNINVLKNDLNH